jgi:homoserine dehydrogenase
MSLTHQAHADRTTPERSRLRIALLGCGTVGSGVANLLLHFDDEITGRSGVGFELAAIAVREVAKPRGIDIPQRLLTGDARSLVENADIDLVIECIGGLGVAAELVETALRNGKHVVTANKELLATRGPELRALANRHHASIAYEAAVGGAIPIVRTIVEPLAGEEILEVGGVVNGTTNFILSEMFEGSSYERALEVAQRRGYAEADPAADVEGIDAAHKLAILSQLAFRHAIVTADIPRTGITAIVRDDVSLAKRIGMTIKLIACAHPDAQIVTPAYVRADHAFAQPVGPQNCVRVIGRASGTLTFAGTGAGSSPTASAVIGDVIAVLRRVLAGRAVHHPFDDAVLSEPERGVALPLRAVIRLDSLRDALPARDALGGADVASRPFDGVPALVTDAAHTDLTALRGVLEARGIIVRSIIPMWDDLPPTAVLPSLHTSSAIATPALGASA